MIGWLLGGVGKVIETTGTAIQKNVKTLKGDKAEAEQHVHAEQMAVLNQYAAEFAGRAPKTWFDSLVDGLNRLPRPIMTFGIIALFCWAVIDPGGFIDVMAALEIVPDALWTFLMLVAGFFFGGRFVKEDLAKPKLTEEQRAKALAIVEKRADAAAAATAANEPIVIAMPPATTERPPQKAPTVPDDRTSSAAIDIMIDDMLEREGGYVNNPADRGGPTNFGITLATLADWRGVACTAEDVKALTLQEAIKIYRAQYYIGPGIDTLPQSLQSHVFDIGVNSGPRAAIKMLQRTLNTFGDPIIVDGIIGDKTRDACRRYDAAKINNALAQRRLAFYQDLAANDPTQRQFLNNWTNRAKSFMAA